MAFCADKRTGSNSKTNNRTKLIVNPLHFIAVGCYGEYLVVAVLGAIDAVVHGSIFVNPMSDIDVVMSINAAHQSRELQRIIIEHTRDVIVELIAIWRRMHDDDGAVEIGRVSRYLALHIVEIRHGSHAVVFHRIGVDAKELDTTDDETEVPGAEHPFVGLVTCTQKIMIAQQYDMGRIEVSKYVAEHPELIGCSRIGHIAAMNYEIDILTSVDVCYLGFGLGVPLMRIADEGNTQRIAKVVELPDACYLCRIDIVLAMQVHVVGMHVENALTSNQHASCQKSEAG